MAGENTVSLVATRETEWLRRVQWPPDWRGGQRHFRLRSEVRFLSCPLQPGGALARRRWKANAGRLRRRRRGQSTPRPPCSTSRYDLPPFLLPCLLPFVPFSLPRTAPLRPDYTRRAKSTMSQSPKYRTRRPWVWAGACCFPALSVRPGAPCNCHKGYRGPTSLPARMCCFFTVMRCDALVMRL